MDVPSSTIDLIKKLKEQYPDKAETDPTIVGTPDFWKQIGVVELLRELEYYIKERGK